MANPPTADELAQQRANQAIQPILAAIATERAAAEQRAAAAQAAEQQRVQGFSLAAADMMRGTGQQVQQGYDLAAQRQATMGKGFSDGYRIGMQQTQQSGNALLAQQGSPQRLADLATGGGDVIYGTTGYLPGTELNVQGAAFGAAASMLPQTAIGRGEQTLADLRHSWAQEAAERTAGYESEARQVRAQLPSLIAQERQTIFERNTAREDRKFRQKQFKEEQRQARTNAQIQWASVKSNAEYLGVSKKKMLMEEAAFMTNQTGELHIVKKGNVVGTGKVASGSDAYGQVAAATAAASKGKGEAAKNRKAALKGRSAALTSTASLVRTEAKDWLGTPIENPKAGSLLNPGKYLDKNGKGTNDPAKAARENALNWNQAISRAMQLEEVQQLIARYNLSPAAARAKVKAWLRTVGFRPPPPRPRPPRLSEGARNAPH